MNVLELKPTIDYKKGPHAQRHKFSTVQVENRTVKSNKRYKLVNIYLTEEEVARLDAVKGRFGGLLQSRNRALLTGILILGQELGYKNIRDREIIIADAIQHDHHCPSRANVFRWALAVLEHTPVPTREPTYQSKRPAHQKQRRKPQGKYRGR